MSTFNSTLIVHLDELLQLIFPLSCLCIVHYISYQDTSTPFDLFNFILGKTVEGVETDLRNVLFRRELLDVDLIIRMQTVNQSMTYI